MGEQQEWVEAVLDEQGRAVRTRGLGRGIAPRKLALDLAVAWANGQAHAVRHHAEQVVSAAEKFAAFLDPPEAPAE